MKKLVPGVLVALLAAGTALAPTAAAQAPVAKADRWLHVRVLSTDARGETVRVNVPLSLAEAVLPSIQAHRLRHGRIHMDDFRLEGVDLRKVLEALRDAPDNEYVTVESPEESVRVAKQAGYLLVKVREHTGSQDKVDVKVPMTVVEALLSGDSDELDLMAGIKALAAHEDTVLVTVNDKTNEVRIWIDSKNTMD